MHSGPDIDCELYGVQHCYPGDDDRLSAIYRPYPDTYPSTSHSPNSRAAGKNVRSHTHRKNIIRDEVLMPMTVMKPSYRTNRRHLILSFVMGVS